MTVTPCPPPADHDTLDYLATPAGRQQALALDIAFGDSPFETSLGALYDAYVALGLSPALSRQAAWTDFVNEAVQ